MLLRLPHEINAFELADRRASIKGELEISCFDRLAELLCVNTGCVTVELNFGKQGRIAVVEGHIGGVLFLQCQRCLHSVECKIDNGFKLGIVGSEAQAVKLQDDYEPLILAEDGTLLLKTLVEDELLLCVPNIPKHISDCSAPVIKGESVNSVAEPNIMTNPFSILADLKNLETQNGSTKK